MIWNSMIEPRNVDEVIAARFGLYHFGLVSAVFLVDIAVFGTACRPSPISSLLTIAEIPGLALDRSAILGFLEVAEFSTLGVLLVQVAGLLHAIAVNSLLYSVILYALLRLCRRGGTAIGHRVKGRTQWVA